METSQKTSTVVPIKTKDLDLNFVAEVKEKSGVNISKCLHCRTCAGGCHFHMATDFAPNHVIRLIQLGFRKEALESSTIWLCVGCNTCSVQCPMAIDMAAVMDAMRQFAIAEGVVVAEPDILNFHKDVLHTIKRYGRTHKLEIMVRYKTRKLDFFSDFGVGTKMFTKRKMHFRPSKVKAIGEVRKSFKS
jgi:heterodisulfide reductase subunit C